MRVKIFDILNNYDNIVQVKDITLSKFADVSYQYMYKFIYRIIDIDIPIVMGIPNNWDTKLIDIYVENYKDLKYIPHLDNKGKLCLFDLEGVLIDKNFIGLLNQTLARTYETLHSGINDLNKEDFIKEYEEYWRRLPNSKKLKLMIDHNMDKSIKLIKYSDNKKKVKKKKGDNYIDERRRENQYNFVCSESQSDILIYKDMKTVKNGIYINIDADDFIYPPDWRKCLNLEYINDLLKHKSVDRNELVLYIHKCKGNLILVFNINQPNGYVNRLGVYIKGYIFDNISGTINLSIHGELIPCYVLRCDREFLVNRGGTLSTIFDKKILVVGCGSIGGYLINELAKIGMNNISIVDGDILREENIYRHFMGMEYIDSYKTKAIKDYLQKNMPYLNVVSYEDYIEEKIESEEISLDGFDLIISTVGNHNLNRWINEYVHLNKIKTPIIYLWNEVLGIGSHAAFISINHKGCYECFFDYDGNIYDKTSYCEKGQIFAKKIMGCGTSYLPFSSTNSIATVISGIELVRSYFEGRINDNNLISIKGDDYYFKKEGFRTSNKYDRQEKKELRVEGEKFVNERCMICGDK